MMILAKLAGILSMVWFYFTGKKMGEPPVKWAIIGLIGYWLSWWLSRELILSNLIGVFTKNTTLIYLVTQIPMICGVIAIIFVRKKLISNAEKARELEDE